MTFLKIVGLVPFIAVLAGCCAIRTRGRIHDKLEAFVIVGFDKRDKCPSAPAGTRGRLIQPGEPLALWFRAVQFNRLRNPVSSRVVEFSVVDALGKIVPDSEATIEPKRVETGPDGFGLLPVTFSASMPGAYLIRVRYPDKQAEAQSYSAPVLVFSTKENGGANVTHHIPGTFRDKGSTDHEAKLAR